MSSLYIFLLVLNFLAYTNSSDSYTFGDCSKPKNNVFKTYGARVKSQLSRSYRGENLNCTLIFKAAEQGMKFRLFLLNVDIPTTANGCSDSLTIKAHNQHLNYSDQVLEKFCGTQMNQELTTEGHFLEITWVGSKATQGHAGFNLVITAVKNTQGPCDTSKYFECEKGVCISSTLFCDGTYNCASRKDEFGCLTTSELIGGPDNKTIDGSKAKRDNRRFNGRILESRPKMTTEDPDDDDYDDDDDDDDDWEGETDSVSIVIVVGVILLIFFICFVIGCRKKDAAENLVQQTLLRSWSRDRSRVSNDPNYRGGEGRPATPPPSYSFIERQTSYVSDISITSSQLSFPPEYDEAVDMPDHANPSNESSLQRSRRSRMFSRNSSRRAVRPVHRVGTFSPGDINARRGSRLQRSMSDGERRPRHGHPQRTSSAASNERGGNIPVPPLHFRIESTTSSIFEHEFEDTMSHLSPIDNAIIEEDVVFTYPTPEVHNPPNNQSNSNNNDVDLSRDLGAADFAGNRSNDLDLNSRSQDHRGDDSDTALLEDDESDLSTNNPTPAH